MKKLPLILLALFSLSIFAAAQSAVEKHLKQSEEFVALNQPAEAIGEMSKAIALEPGNARLYLLRAEIYFGSNNPEAVVADVKKAVSLEPADKQTILTAARFLRNIRKCAESLALLDEFIAGHESFDDVYYSRSHAKFCLEDLAGAFEDISTAAELAPKNTVYTTAQAGLIARLGDSGKALDFLAQLIARAETKLAKARSEPEKEAPRRDLARAYQTRAGIRHAKGETAAEFEDLAQFVKYSPDEFGYRHRARVYFDHQMFAEALADYAEIIRRRPGDEVFLIERGDIYAAAGKFDEAARDYAKALELDATLGDVIRQRQNWLKSKMLEKSAPK
jgi:tetratricopeptide (TPR) repeat protein